MSLERMTSRYIASTEHVLKEVEIIENSVNVNGKGVRKLWGMLKPICKMQNIIGIRRSMA